MEQMLANVLSAGQTGQIVNNKIFLAMLGTIPNHEYESKSVFNIIIHHDRLGRLIDSVSGWDLRGRRIDSSGVYF